VAHELDAEGRWKTYVIAVTDANGTEIARIPVARSSGNGTEIAYILAAITGKVQTTFLRACLIANNCFTSF